jgi:hypothetical protein
VNGEPFRGFESHPLRHNYKAKGRSKKEKVLVLIFAFYLFTFYLLFRGIMRSKSIHVALAIAALPMLSVLNADTLAQKRRPVVKHLSVCGNPMIPCKTSATFEPYALPFRVPEKAVIYDTELFYAVILKSVKGEEDDCNVFIPESERQETQTLFPDHKVFTSRCNDLVTEFFTNISRNSRIMAVYAGTTLADANRMLAAVKATGKFPGTNIRRMRTGFNGT